MTNEELLELAWGLLASKKPYIWVIHLDLIHGHFSVMPSEFLEKSEEQKFFGQMGTYVGTIVLAG